MASYQQFDIFGNAEIKRIFFRDRLGRFASKETSEMEKLFRENNRLKNEVEMWRRKAEVLAKYKIHNERKDKIYGDNK